MQQARPPEQRPYFPSILLAVYDMAAVTAALLLALALRFNSVHPSFLLRSSQLPLTLALYLTTFHMFRLYRTHWRFASVEVLWAVSMANLLATGIALAWQRAMPEPRVPLSGGSSPKCGPCRKTLGSRPAPQ